MGRRDPRRRVRLLWLLVLLLPSVPAQGFTVDLQEVTFDVAPETWKSRPPQEATAADDLGVWSASLGLHANVTLAVPTGTDWTYHATLSDGITRLVGYVTEDRPGIIIARFDVDGQRAHNGQDAIPALQSGTWRVEVEARQGDRLEGRGGASFATGDLDFSGLGEPGLLVPESILPHIREVGPGDAVWMPLQSRDGPFTASLNLPQASTVTWDVWIAISGANVPTTVSLPLPGIPDPLALTPLGTQDPTDLATVWLHGELAHVDLPAGRVDFSFNVPEDAALVVFTAHTDQGGMAHFVVPVRGGPFSWSEVVAQPGSAAPVSVTVDGPTDAPLPAELHVVNPEGALVTSSVLVPVQDAWRGVYDGITTREQGLDTLGLVVFFQDLGGGYAGHVAGLRGMDVSLQGGPLGVGVASTVDAVLSHAHPLRDAGFSLPALVHVRFGDDVQNQAEISMGAGTEQTRSHLITPARPGTERAEVTIDTGDLLFTVHRDFEVLDRAAYDEATAPWYDVPGPALGLLVLSLAFLALRKREI